MKLILTISVFLLTLVKLQAQQTTLAPDQNPNYILSQSKYMGIKDSLSTAMNTTVQSTYKAYDWYEARTDRRQERRDYRRQIRYSSNMYQGYSTYYNNNYYTPYNRWNNGYWSNRNFIGYRTGNWFLGL